MSRFWKILLGLVIIGIIALLLIIFWPKKMTNAEDLTLSDDVMNWPETQSGEYIARLGDCAGCHGEDLSGGLAFNMMGGSIYADNITPDAESGIGGWTLDQFRAAMVDGIDEEGKYLYPAMPYDSFHKMAERDIAALYDYFMNDVSPVSNLVPANDMPFPLNQRWGIRLWKWIGMPKAGFQAEGEDGQINRGAYLVESLGHCGSCHTPRGKMTYTQKGFSGDDEKFLTGGVLNGWPAPSLRGDNSAIANWSDDALKAFLQTGRNSVSGVSGEMEKVIEHSMQYFEESDIDAVIAYLRMYSPYVEATSETNFDTENMLTAADPNMELGPRLYLDNCGACHFVDGRGAADIFPHIDGNAIVIAQEPGGLIDVILHGAMMPSTKDAPYEIRMPGFSDRLNDDEVAALATFVRSAWSNKAGEVTVDDVAKWRKSE